MRAVARPLLTEDDLVAAVRETLAQSAASHARPLRVGIGDDAAAWKVWGKHLSLITTDMLVDDVHFRLTKTSPQQLGHKALAQSLSDIAAMGGQPTLAVVALGLTPAIDEAWVRAFYQGMAALANTYRCAIAGGDIVRAPALTVAVTVTGEVRRTTMRLRSGARPGDIAAVTGPLGWAAAGLRILDKGLRGELKLPVADAVCNAYLTPLPRLREGGFLASRRACRALMDISDGLSTDIARMALASGVDATLDRSSLAPDPFLSEAARLLHIDALEFILNGGDDYELLAAIEPRAYKHVARAYKARFGRELRALGTFAAGDGHVWLQENKKRTALPRAGWDHLKM